MNLMWVFFIRVASKEAKTLKDVLLLKLSSYVVACMTRPFRPLEFP